MRKVAIFTEGQSELIFVRTLIPILYGYGQVNFECFKLIGDSRREVPYKSPQYPDAKIYILIVNVEGDSQVISAIKEREEGLFQQGYQDIIGLRDMFSEMYCDLASVIDDGIISKIIQGHDLIREKMHHPGNIYLFFAVMEFEAWLLSMYNLWRKIDALLSVEYIEQRLNINLREINPETEFFHPSREVGRILNLVEMIYCKSNHQMESILSRIDDGDILQAVENGRCGRFNAFLDKLESF